MRIFFKKSILHFGILFALTLFGLLFYSNSFNSPFERDEGEYAYSAWLLKKGVMPYEHSFLQKPPAIIYYYFLSSLVNPDEVWPPRVLAFVFTLATAVLVGLIAKKEFGCRAGPIAAFIFIPMNAFPYLAPFAANTERFMQLPLMGVVAIYVYARNKSSFWPLFWAGALGMLAFLTKQVCALPLSFLFCFWVLEKSQLSLFLKEKFIHISRKIFQLSLLSNDSAEKKVLQKFSREKLSSALKCLLCLSGGAIFGFFIVSGYFLVKVEPRYLWETWIVFNRYYATQFSLENFPKYFNLFLVHWWILLFFIPWIFLRKLSHRKFYITLLALSLLSVIVSPIGHYYLLLMPFWGIISAAGIEDIGKNIHRNTTSPFVFAVITLAIIIFPVLQQFKKNPEEMAIWIYGFGNPFLEAKIAADQLERITAPDEKVFIAGSEPEIMFYSKRQSVSRFAITYPLIIETPAREIYQREAAAELEKNLPAAIVFSNQEESGLWNNESPRFFIDFLERLLKDNYILVGGYVRDKNGNGEWQSPLTKKNIPIASLLLYKEK